MTKEHIEKLERAEDILLSLYWDIREDKSLKSESKRLDTILGKIHQLKHIDVYGNRYGG